MGPVLVQNRTDVWIICFLHATRIGFYHHIVKDSYVMGQLTLHVTFLFIAAPSVKVFSPALTAHIILSDIDRRIQKDLFLNPHRFFLGFTHRTAEGQITACTVACDRHPRSIQMVCVKMGQHPVHRLKAVLQSIWIKVFR